MQTLEEFTSTHVDGVLPQEVSSMARTDEAITKIRELIAVGDLRPGDRLPPEAKLCEMLGMSRGSMREAVKSLEVAGVLDVRRGDGTYVTTLEPQLLLQGIGFAVQLLQDADLADVMQIRRVLEAEATAQAATVADDALLTALANDLENMRAAVEKGDTEDLVRHDATFHERVIAACGNRTLATLLNGLSSRTLRARIWRGLQEQQADRLTISQHETILTTLRDHDPEAARAASLIHVAMSQRWLQAIVSESPAADGAASHGSARAQPRSG